LAVFAHPDDETFGSGSTLARYASEGVDITVVCATRGEAGEIAPGSDATSEILGDVREAELRSATVGLPVIQQRAIPSEHRDPSPEKVIINCRKFDH
jgi:LmbE family N-acetylglucosaminyl deacetylase